MEGLLHAPGNKTDFRMAEMIFNIILKHIQDLIYVMKVEDSKVFRYVFVNEIAFNHAKMPEDYIGKTLQDVLPIETAKHIQEKYERVISERTVISYQDQLTLPDGRTVYGESILTPVFNESGSIEYVVSVTRDVTNSVHEKNKLMESQQRYKSLMDHNMDAVFSLDRNGIFQHANPSTFQLLGYSEKDLLKTSIFSLVSKNDKEKFHQMFFRSVEGSTKESLICHLIHKDGRKIKVQFKTVPIFVNGAMIGIYGIVRDITEQSRAEEMIKYMAYHDYLTGLPNRSSLKKRLNEAIKEAKITHETFAVMFIDLDRFKFINDSMGHNIGDQLLKEVAERLTAVFEEEDCVFRQGGDEFIILLRNCNRKIAATFAEKIIHAFQNPFQIEHQEFYMTTSIGISLYPNDGEDDETLIKNADNALYRVKEKGKGNYQFYSADMLKATPHLLLIETGLRKAAVRSELQVYYQPQVTMNTGTIHSFEALLRWNSPLLGCISPSQFIPLAEETGLIIPIGEWVIDSVCEQIKLWENQGYQKISVAVNLSAKQFHQANLAEVIYQKLKKHNVQPDKLEIEITEGVMRDTKETLFILDRLKEIGIRISIDDFGTGYSSLSYLKRFPIDALKIDQSFVKDILIDKKDAAITKTIIHLAESLEMDVIAEGVENEEQAVFLQHAGCHKAQGYYFGEPLPAEDVELLYLKLDSKNRS
jgi:diguanylate cyclase (GGDEF)-like protein/PAS domain S-box-containing protein